MYYCQKIKFEYDQVSKSNWKFMGNKYKVQKNMWSYAVGMKLRISRLWQALSDKLYNFFMQKSRWGEMEEWFIKLNEI